MIQLQVPFFFHDKNVTSSQTLSTFTCLTYILKMVKAKAIRNKKKKKEGKGDMENLYP